MTGKNTDTDNHQWSDPKDYGLPYVIVTPIAESIQAESVEEIAKPIDVKNVKKQTIQSIQVKSIEHPIPTKPIETPEVKKSSSSWIWIAALLALAVVLVIIWQMNSAVSNDDSKPVVAESVEAVASMENDQVAENSNPLEEIQTVEDQVAIDESLTSAESITPTPQSGTTIDHKAIGNLVRVTEKGARPTFYIIVGSLPSEAMALSEAPQYYDRSETIYLIMPYGDSKNYRLAIDQSIGFTAMTEELARVKDQYKEELWILKY